MKNNIEIAQAATLRPISALAADRLGIPEEALRRRFLLSLAYLETTYKPLADDWKVYASGGEVLELLDWGPR